MEITLIAIPTLVPVPYGKEITSTTLDDIFIEEMKSILLEHGFWAQTMSNVVDQHEIDNHTETVLTRMINTVPASSSCDPACDATKGLRGMIFMSSPFVDPSLLSRSNSFEANQEKLKEFFCRNPTPTRVEDINNDEGIKEA